jgi:hypothetical protein
MQSAVDVHYGPALAGQLPGRAVVETFDQRDPFGDVLVFFQVAQITDLQ